MNILIYRNLGASLYVITVTDFQKAYALVDRHSLFQTLTELLLDDKTTKLVKATLTDTSIVKFYGLLSKSFKIKTCVRQGDG